MDLTFIRTWQMIIGLIILEFWRPLPPKFSFIPHMISQKTFSFVIVATAAVSILGFQSCKGPKATTDVAQVYVDTAAADWGYVIDDVDGPYRASYTRHHDLIHTKLEVSFDWAQQRLNGKATLTLKPYFYPTSNLVLDAKGFDIHKVALLQNGKQTPLNYTYDDLKLDINLGKELTRKDTFNIYIEYTAKPNELASGGSAAITSDKGLYFINPLGEEKGKPMQIWTQGETESSSCWFPTIEAGNERCTEEIYMTVDSKYKTLSNGLLVSSIDNGDGTKTDYWKQTMPHAPYLFMMAVGDFAIVKDKWNGMDVDYYVEHEYEPYAQQIFGNTPEMLTFFSEKLGVRYPWEKYAQIVVRDYVSGAMENTTATVHGEFIQRTDRELLDETYEDIISHELFHQWFGDLVTCESWSNLPLNESFATYGEYLWREYKYGRDAADQHLNDDLKEYMQQGAKNKQDLIRFYYDDKEDMFDTHSYSKGGRILHMLRKYVGDDAFFTTLKAYLTEHQFTDVEVHELRLAFEDVTGEDLNWFFNQWFLDKGHPELVIEYVYEPGVAQVSIEQKQSFTENPLYKLPMKVDVYAGGKVKRHDIVLEGVKDTFEFPYTVKPDLINVDAEKMLVCAKSDKKSVENYIFQYKNAPLFMDRLEALDALSTSSKPEAMETIITALDDKFYSIRVKAINSLALASAEQKESLKDRMMGLAKNDEKSAVRAAAVDFVVTNYKEDEKTLPLLEEAINDKSYSVVGVALAGISKIDKKRAVASARKAQKDARSTLIYSISSILAEHGDESDLDFFLNSYTKVSDFGSKYGYVTQLGKYLKNQSADVVLKGLDVTESITIDENTWYMRLVGAQSLAELYKASLTKANEMSDLQASAAEVNAWENVGEKAKGIAAKAMEKEDNDLVISYLEQVLKN